MQKLTAIFTTPSGWALIIAFLLGGFTAIKGNGGNLIADIITVLSALGAIYHPTNMTAGKSLPSNKY